MSPTKIITQGSWNHALFTTYALSLSFYETQLHKLGLARNGCRDIRIITDIDGYQISLSERQSHRVGNEYRLTPTTLPNGVFHPKIGWLAGREVDILLLGSGNLTFGGFGKNVECLEVIRSDKHPNLFAQVHDLMVSWSEREDLKFPGSNWLDFWIERAANIASSVNESSPDNLSLLHSTIEPIGRQLTTIALEKGGAREVRSLSPYYDSNGWGIIKFAESVGAKKLCIGLLSGRETSTTFPFNHHYSSNIQIAAATLNTPEDKHKRQLHAKILEVILNDGSTLLLTGSVNATRKSLLTNDNIETAILRHYPAGENSPFQWTPAPTPTHHETSEFSKAGLGSRVVVSASLTSEGKLEGSLISKNDPSGEWSGTLQRIDGEFSAIIIHVSSNGTFSTPLPDAENFLNAPGLQLHVTSNDQKGTGWVHVEGMLVASRQGFLPPSTLMRLLGTNADESDEAEFLRYLSQSAQRHLNAFSSTNSAYRSRQVNEPSNTEPENRTVPIEMLTTDLSSNGTEDNVDQVSHADDYHLNAYILRIRSRLLQPFSSHAPTDSADEVDDATNDKSSNREQKERQNRTKALKVSLQDFQQKLREIVVDSPPGALCSNTLCMLFEGVYPVLLKRLKEPDEAEVFLRQWLSLVVPKQTQKNSNEVLIGHTLSAILTIAAAECSRLGSFSNSSKTLGILHETLDYFCAPESPELLCNELGIFNTQAPPLPAQLLTFLPTTPSLHDALAAIQLTPTPLQQINSIIDATENGKDIPDGLPILKLDAGINMANLIDAGYRPITARLHASKTVCPHCNMRLRQGTAIDIKRDRFGCCGNCSGFLLATL